MASLSINCGNAVILRYRPEAFDAYDKIQVNAGSALISSQAYAELNKKHFTLNAGSSEIIDIKGEVVDLGEDVRLEGGEGYEGKFLVAEKLLIAPQALPALAGVEGVYAETLFYPASTPTALVARLTGTGRKSAYPDDARLEMNSLDADALYVDGLADNTCVWCPGTLTMLDEGALRAARKKGVRFECRKLFVYQSLYNQYKDILKTERQTLVPDGLAVVKKAQPLKSLLAVYGPKLYVCGNLRIDPADAAALAEAEQLVVERKLTIPLELARAFHEKGQAGSVFTYEGTLWDINGKEALNHAALAAAREAGIQYTLRVNGILRFDEDVTAEDLAPILALHYNGVVEIGPALQPLLNQKVLSANGVMVGNEQMEKMKNELGMDAEATNINTGSYRLV